MSARFTLKVECCKIDVEGYELGFKFLLEDVFVPLRIQPPVEQLNLRGGLDIRKRLIILERGGSWATLRVQQ